MNITILQCLILFSIVCLIILLGYLCKTKKISQILFIVAVFWCLILGLFTFDVSLLDNVWSFFWIDRWANLIVYVSIILLTFFSFSVLNNVKKQDIVQTNLIREFSLLNARWSLNKSDIVFIIPAYNEKDRPLNIVGEILKKWYWVILVDDWENGDLLDRAFLKYQWKDLVLIKHILNLWQWAWLETWSEYIRRFWDKVKYIVHFDADWQHRLQDISQFLDAFDKDETLEIVLWSRFLWSTINMPKMKKITLKLWIIFTWMLSGIKLTDTHNWYRMIKKTVLDKIYITMNRMEHASEIIDIIKTKNLKYKEVPITVIYTEYSMLKWQKISNAFKIAKNLLYNKMIFK